MRSSKGVVFGIAAVSAVASGARPAQADSRSVAEALFRDGTQLLGANRIDEACPKLAESQKLDPALGTLFYLAVCHEQQGLTATAWSEFTSATEWAERTNQPERIAFGRKHLQDLNEKLSTVVLQAESAFGLELRLDDGLLSTAAIGTPLPLDPGRHVIVASAPGHQPWQTTVNVESTGQALSVTIPALTAVTLAPKEKTKPLEADSEPPLSGQISEATQAPAAPHSPTNVLLWTAASVTGASAVLGTVFGIMTFGARDRAISECPGNVCGPGGFDDIDRARSFATVSTVSFGVGLAAAIATGYLWLRGDGVSNHSTSATTSGPSIFVSPSGSQKQASITLTARIP
jgi:hypothetical protein